jgi:hypothetical protein
MPHVCDVVNLYSLKWKLVELEGDVAANVAFQFSHLLRLRFARARR